MKIKTIFFLPQLSFVLSFFANTTAIACEGEVAVEARQGRAQQKTPKFGLKSMAHPSQRIPSLSPQRLANKDSALPLKKIEHNDLHHLFKSQIGEEVEIQGKIAQLTSMDTRAVEQVRELLQNPTTTAWLANINTQKIGLKKQKAPPKATYQLYCNGRVVPECKAIQVIFPQE